METIVQPHDTARIGNSGDGAQTDKPNRIIVDWPVFRFGYLDSRVSNKRTMTTVGRRKCDGRSTGVRAPTIGRTSGGRKTKGRTRRPSLKWWRWRESNPRPTTFRSSIYMLSRSLIFIDRSRTGTDRAHLFTLGFSVLASDLPLSRVDESRRLLPGHQHHRGNRSPGLSGEGVVSVVRN